MKQYLLLRENRQSGPFTQDEMYNLQLRQNDLVWIENESTAWRYPREIHELEKAVTSEGKQKVSAVYVELPLRKKHDLKIDVAKSSAEPNLPSLESTCSPQFDRSAETFPSKKAMERNLWARKFIPRKNAMNIAAVFVGLIATSIFMKKIVDGLVDQSFGSAETPASLASMIPVETAADKTYQNALVTTPVIKTEEKTLPKPTKPKDIRKMIGVKASDYNTGLFGGIKGLDITVSNNSPHLVNQVEVLINYLKPNGDIIMSETFPVRLLKPKSSKTISIPPSKRGKRVNFKIVSVYSKQYQSLLREI